MLTLYQFPISHYCEKIRWALDYKGLEYKFINLLPGAHIKVIKSLAPKSEVPVLRHNDKVIQNSSDIITYLDDTFPDKSLTPVDPEQRQQALEWESYADNNIGPHVRLYMYQYLLDRPDITIPFLAHSQPWHKRFMFRLIYPKVRDRMRSFMQINDRTAGISLKKINRAVDKLATHFKTNNFLAGERFSRADLAAASMLAPFRGPVQYGLHWPKTLPEPLQQASEVLADKLQWVDGFYQDFR